MGLVVETGLIVPNANSYVSVVDFKSYAQDRGLTVPDQTEGCESLLIRACDFLEGLDYIGQRVDPNNQPLAWPRKCAWLDGVLLAYNSIPRDLRSAQCELAFAAQNVDLFPILSAQSKGIIASESVFGAVSRTYFQKSTPDTQPYISQARNLLRRLTLGGGPVGFANVIRA